MLNQRVIQNCKFAHLAPPKRILHPRNRYIKVLVVMCYREHHVLSPLIDRFQKKSITFSLIIICLQTLTMIKDDGLSVQALLDESGPKLADHHAGQSRH